MNLKNIAFVVLTLGLALVLAGMFAPAFAGMRGAYPVQGYYAGPTPVRVYPAAYARYRDTDPNAWNIREMRPDSPERGPSFSSPQVERAPNGDRVSPYAPGYRPER